MTNNLFCDDINMRAAAYADKHVDTYMYNKRVWNMVADAYVDGAVSQYNIDNKQ